MRILVTGANGMLGRALIGEYRKSNDYEVFGWSRADVDLRVPSDVRIKLHQLKPDLVVHAAAVVGGIQANINHPVAHLADNLLIDSAIMLAAVDVGVENLLYVGSSCMYPKDYRQPLQETDILAAPLEPTNEGYALAKISGSKLADSIAQEFGLNFRTIIPSNLYGPGDNFSAESSHLVAATIRKALNARNNFETELQVWGDGTARREFTFIEDLAAWVVSNSKTIKYLPQKLNLGAGLDHSIDDYYIAAMNACEYVVPLKHDLSKPVGMKAKLMDSSIAKEQFNWMPSTDLMAGMKKTLDYYLENLVNKK